MKPEATGSGHLCLFLLASLAVHLGIACAVTGGRDGAGGREHPSAALTVEYLDLSSLNLSPAGGRGQVAGDAAADVTPYSASDAQVVNAGYSLPPARPLAPSHPPTEARQDKAVPPTGGLETGKRVASDPAPVSGAMGGRESKPSTSGPGVAVRDGGEGAALDSGSSSGKGAQEGTAASKRVAGEGAQGRKGSSGSVRGWYQQQLKSLIESHKKYPMAARRSRQEGSCVRRFSLGRDGALKSVESVTSCGHPFLDGAATGAVTSVGMFPPLPDEFGVEESFSVTITFTLAGK